MSKPPRSNEDAISATILEIENASLLADLELLPGVRETIPALAAAGYRLGIISDTSLTTGRILRSFLEKDGLLDCFTALTFSDETGYPKPDRRMFESTLAELGADPAQAVHVGDTPRTDIAGAKALGMVDHPLRGRDRMMRSLRRPTSSSATIARSRPSSRSWAEAAEERSRPRTH